MIFTRYYTTLDEPVILFRRDKYNTEEYNIAKKYFPVEVQRSACSDSFVIGRYSVLPYYEETYRDLKINYSNLINTPEQHNWISSFAYYLELSDYTPESWDDATIIDTDYDGPFVVKGTTNSMKFYWDTMMYAEDRQEAFKIANKLLRCGQLEGQSVIYRKYVPLKTFEIGANGLPFTNEWRFFYYKTTMLSYGYYWSIADDLKKPYMTTDGINLASDVAAIVASRVPFFCIDIAETEEGDWILIEVNDGQMSGLQEVDPDHFYSSLKKAI